MNGQSPRHAWRRFGLSFAGALVIVGSAFFLVLTATWRLDSPGLYYDEMIFFPAAARVFESCNVWAWVYVQIGCVPILLHPAYVGALKSDLYGVLFAFLEPGIVAVRAPMIALHGINIALMIAFWRARLGSWLSLALLVLLCTDVAATFHARVDWGTYAIATFFKVVALGWMMAWIETGRTTYFQLCAVALILGVLDKLNFIWIVTALITAGLAVYPREIISSVRRHRAAQVTLLVAAIVGAVVTATMAVPAFAMNLGKAIGFVPQVVRAYDLLIATVDGAAAYGFVFGEGWAGLKWASRVMLGGVICGVVFVLLTPIVRARLGREHPVAVKCAYAAFVTVILLVLFACMALTKELSGSHHLIFVSFLWPLQLVLCGAAAIALLRHYYPSMVSVAAGLAGCVAGIVVVHNAYAAALYLSAIDKGMPENHRFSLAIYDLAEYLNRIPDASIVSVDWGLNNSLMVLAKPGTRRRYFDFWPFFIRLGEGTEPVTTISTILGRDGDAVFVMHPPATATFPATNKGFSSIVRQDPLCKTVPVEIADRAGRVQYHVVRLPKSCLVSSDQNGVGGGTP